MPRAEHPKREEMEAASYLKPKPRSRFRGVFPASRFPKAFLASSSLGLYMLIGLLTCIKQTLSDSPYLQSHTHEERHEDPDLKASLGPTTKFCLKAEVGVGAGN